MKCKRCNRELKNPDAIAAGIGPTCSKYNNGLSADDATPKVVCLSHRPDGSRTYLVLPDRRSVRIFGPHSDGSRSATCTCPTAIRDIKCSHIVAAGSVDADILSKKGAFI